YLIGVKACETLDTLLIFTSKGSYVYLPVYRIDEGKFRDLGKHISSYVRMEGNEKVVGAFVVKNFDTYAFILTATRKGMIKKTSVPRFNVNRASKALPAMKLRNDDELVSVALCYEDDDIITVSKDGHYNKFSGNVLSDLAPRALGVGAINVKADALCGVVVDRHNNSELLLCTDKGGFKRIHFADLEFTSRNTKGNRLFKQIKSNPHTVVYCLAVSAYVSLVFDQSESVSLAASEIPFMDTEATFSSPLNVDGHYSFVRDDMNDIEEVKIIDLPADYYRQEDDYDQTNLFEE
ncbi:MAG: hypothetical protein IKF68_06695, partial [Erysipelotrichaceae bacterium]|nr:hypothetical protein [Erysipelotrichaceae bacterium]